MPLDGNSLMTRPLTPPPLLVPARVSPLAPEPALVPTSSINGVPVYPGWLVPSMVTDAVIAGSAESGVMTCTPVPMLKSIVEPGAALALVIACRKEPGPLSAVVLTTNVEGIIRFSRPWKSGWKGWCFFRLRISSRRRLILRRL